MADSKSATLAINATNSEALRKIAEIQAAYDEARAQIEAEGIELSGPQDKALTGGYNSAMRSSVADTFKQGAKDGIDDGMSDAAQDVEGDSSGLFASLKNAFSSVTESTGADGGLMGMLGNPVGIAAVTAAVVALGSEVGALTTGLTAAAAGAGSFVALAVPSFDKLKTAVAGGVTGVEQLPDDLKAAGFEALNAKNSFDSMSKALEPVVGQVALQGLAIMVKYMGVLKPLAESFGNGLSSALQLLGKQLTAPVFSEFAQKMEQLSGPVITALMSGFIGLAKDVANLMLQFSNKDVINSINILFRATGFAIEFIGNAIKVGMVWWDELTDEIKIVAGLLTGNFTAASNAAKNALTSLGINTNWLKDIWSTTWANMKDAVESGASYTINEFRNIIDSIGSMGSQLYHNMISVGENIIIGIINGIEGEAGRLFSEIDNIANQVSSAFTSVLGIFSPSRVFAQHGKNIVEGLALGITSNSHLATQAVTTMGHSVSMAGSMGTSAGGRAGNLQIEWVGGSGADAGFITWLKQSIRVRGGNPAVLGR